MRYLLDTTWAAEYLRGRSAFVSAIEERRNEGLAISVVTLAELFSGVARAQNPDKAEKDLGRFLSDVRVLGIDERICRIWGQEDARLTRTGTQIGDLDLFIVATALAYSLKLCTPNRKHFDRIATLEILSL